MFKLIIADDEAYVCKELSQLLDWDELGIELAGTFLNGTEVLDFIKDNSVDIIISDIKMPSLSGIDLAKICHENYPDIHLILVSAYREFDYAKEAIKYGVQDYLVKPITYEAFKSTIIKATKALDTKNYNFNLSDNKFVIKRQHFFINFLSGFYNSNDDISTELKEIGININITGCTCAIINLEIMDFEYQMSSNWKYGKERFYNAISMLIPAEFRSMYLSLLNINNEEFTIIVLNKAGSIDFDRLILELSNVLKKNIKSTLDMDVTITVLQKEKSLFKLKNKHIDDNLLSYYVKDFISFLIDGNKTEAQKYVTAIINNFDDIASQNKIYNKIVVSLSEIKNKYNINQFNLRSVGYFETKEELAVSLSELFEKAIEYFSNIGEQTNNIIINRAISYINANYNKDITLDEIADYVSLSPVYFSTYFKQYTGVKFIDYLIRVKMEKAKQLIENDPDCKIYLVCEHVGYKSISYFHKLFFNYTGLTPAEYKKKFIKKE